VMLTCRVLWQPCLLVCMFLIHVSAGIIKRKL
jgi:hypothetical protein